MAYGKYTVLLEKCGVRHKLCKIWFGADGSYYVSSPYHPAQKAALLKVTVNYARSEMRVPFEEFVDVASVEDDERRLKLAHHPDGFIQFSGRGVLSGKDANGVIRGMGIMSWPLDAPMRGPAFSITVRGVEQFAPAQDTVEGLVVFRYDDLAMPHLSHALILEGHYFPDVWRRFVRYNSTGEPIISVVHPAGAVLPLKAIFPSERCKRQGFIGLEVYGYATDNEEGFPSPSFALATATGNVRENLEGELIAEGMYAMYPRSTIPTRRALDYLMDEIPPTGHAHPNSIRQIVGPF